MGGRASGRKFRWDKKTALEGCRFIDIRDWKRDDLLRDGYVFDWHWSQNGVRKASMRVFTACDHVRVDYAFRRWGDAWQDINETIRFSVSPCHLGGERLWFCCPGCGRRAAKLYLYSPHFRCRLCLGLPYASQQKTILDRAYRKAFKLRNRLNARGGIGDPIWEKPKGMHWNTFERLQATIERQDEITNSAFFSRASKMLGWM